jgi:hypothetical protein
MISKNSISKVLFLSASLLFIAPGFAAVGTADAASSGSYKAEIYETGIFETVGEVRSVDAPQTAPGKVGEYSGIKLVEATTSFATKKGLTFGFRYRVTGPKDGEVQGFEMFVMHPPMRGTDGKMHTIQSAPIELFFENKVAKDDVVYILAEDFEVLPGTWTLQVRLAGKPILSRTFVLK